MSNLENDIITLAVNIGKLMEDRRELLLMSEGEGGGNEGGNNEGGGNEGGNNEGGNNEGGNNEGGNNEGGNNEGGGNEGGNNESNKNIYKDIVRHCLEIAQCLIDFLADLENAKEYVNIDMQDIEDSLSIISSKVDHIMEITSTTSIETKNVIIGEIENIEIQGHKIIKSVTMFD